MKYIVEYRVCIEAGDEDMAELYSFDIESQIKGLSKKVVWVDSNPYMEEVDD